MGFYGFAAAIKWFLIAGGKKNSITNDLLIYCVLRLWLIICHIPLAAHFLIKIYYDISHFFLLLCN